MTAGPNPPRIFFSAQPVIWRLNRINNAKVPKRINAPNNGALSAALRISHIINVISQLPTKELSGVAVRSRTQV
jgi:hypothetical protein